MEWYLRFSMGLPPRNEDICQLKEVLPELFDKKYEVYNNRQFDHIFMEALQKWVSEKPLEHNQENFNLKDKEESNFICPLLKNNSSIIESSNLFSMMTVGGYKNNLPKKKFIELVKKVHKNQKVKEIIITDKYIYSDKAEDQTPGGYDNFIEYLDALKIDKEKLFTVITNPRAKGTDASKKNFQKTIKNNYNSVEFKEFNGEYKFHDRLYLVKDTKAQIKGIFGPSLNGLTSEAIVLMGDISDCETLRRLNEMF